MDELKPCPFCGGKAKVAKVHPSFMLKKLHYLYFAAGCTKCNVSTPLFQTQKTGSPLMNEHYDEEAKQKAIEAWNKRVDIKMEDQHERKAVSTRRRTEASMNLNNMDDVIQEFVCCTRIPPNCKECPQKGPGKDHGHQCRADVKTDVLHALEAYRDCIRNKE